MCLVGRIFPTFAAKVWREAHLFRRRRWRTETLVWTGSAGQSVKKENDTPRVMRIVT